MEEKQKSARGQEKDFPVTTLIVAEEVVKAVSDAGGKISSKAISASLGDIKGGALARKIASAKRWSLIKGSGILEITALGKKIVHNINEDELVQSRKEAFLSVELFKKLYERFGVKLPTEQTFIAILVREYELTDKNARTMLTIYKEAIKLYLGAEIASGVVGTATGTETPHTQFPRKNQNISLTGKIEVSVNSPMGSNSFKADNKAEFKILKSKLNKLLDLLEDELPAEETHDTSGQKAQASDTDLRSVKPADKKSQQ